MVVISLLCIRVVGAIRSLRVPAVSDLAAAGLRVGQSNGNSQNTEPTDRTGITDTQKPDYNVVVIAF